MLLLVILSIVQFFYLNTKKPAQNHYNKNDQEQYKNLVVEWFRESLGNFLLWTFRSSSKLTAI